MAQLCNFFYTDFCPPHWSYNESLHTGRSLTDIIVWDGVKSTHSYIHRRLNSVPFVAWFGLFISPLFSHHLFYSSFNQFYFSLSTSKCSSSGGVSMATAVARQHTTLHHPFQKSDRWRERIQKHSERKKRACGTLRDYRDMRGWRNAWCNQTHTGHWQWLC